MTTARFVVTAACRDPEAATRRTPDTRRTSEGAARRIPVMAARRTPPAGAPGVPPTMVGAAFAEAAVDEVDGAHRTVQPLTASRVAAWQVALVLGFLAPGRGWAVAAGCGCAAAILLLLGAVRVRGTWLSTAVRFRLAFAGRRRNFPTGRPPLPRGTTIAAGGLLTGAGGLTAVARTREMILPEADGPGLDLQLVVHRAAGSAQPRGWVAISARRDADTGGDDELRAALANAVRRLRRRGHDLVVASAADVRDDLIVTSAANVRDDLALTPAAGTRDDLGATAGAGASRECWRHWRCGSSIQVTLRITGGRVAVIHRLLAEGRDAAVTVALRAGGDGVLRVSASSPQAAERAVDRMRRAGARAGVRLTRLDGRHQLALFASMPIGETF